MESFKRNFKWYVLTALLMVFVSIWYAVLAADGKGLLKVAVLDIGQGDSIYIEAPNGRQMIIDGGPPGALLPALSKVMPFSDRSVDMIMVTNPDQDHFAGFLDLLDSYQVGAVIESGTFNKSKIFERLENSIAEKKIPKVLGRRGMVVDLGAGVHLEILFPDRDVSSWKPNDGSIIAKLVYGDTSVMLTGDATSYAESLVIKDAKDPKELKSDLLKVGHHGSRTSTGESFLKEVNPVYVAISDGRDNKYGHPHKETLDTLNKYRVKILRTDELGTIIFESDGQNIWLEK